MKFRKKPVVIEAVQLTWQTWPEVCDFVPKPTFLRGVFLDRHGMPLPDGQTSERMGLELQTLEGVMLASQEDWIVKVIKGEFYPVKPDIFEATYERVE